MTGNLAIIRPFVGCGIAAGIATAKTYKD